MTRISIIEDADVLADQLAKVIESHDDWTVSGRHTNFESAVSMIPAERVDVVILDIGLKGRLTGLDCLVRLKHDFPEMEFIVHTGLSEESLLFKALKLGASGYIEKDGDVSSVVRGIKNLLQGGAPMSMSIARRVLRSFWEIPGNRKGLETLTDRQAQITQLISQGLQNSEISDRLGISEGGVQGHLHRIYRKMHINNRTELALLYRELRGRGDK